jgi:outer membrane immunogenic protein
MKKTLFSTIATVSLLAFSLGAQAADLPPRPAPYAAPVAVPVMDWTGFYLGLNGGYSWGRAGRDITFFNPLNGVTIVPPVGTGTTSDSNLNGAVFGGQIGYNWQTSNWVFGLETDAQWTGQRGSAAFLCGGTIAGGACLPGLTFLPAGALGTAAAVDQKLEWFGTFRGRFGVAVTPSVLLYATGGAAYGSIKTNVALAGFTPAGVPITAAGSSSDIRLGWTVGAGIEAMLASNWSAKLEYLYVDLGTFSSSAVLPIAGGALGIGATLNSHVTDSIVRAGINYHFSAGPSPVVARY